MIKYMAVAVAVAVSGSVAVPVAVPAAMLVTGLTERFFNQKDVLINVWGSWAGFAKAQSEKDRLCTRTFQKSIFFQVISSKHFFHFFFKTLASKFS